MRFFTLALLATSALTGAPAFAADAASDDAPATAPTAAAATAEGADNDIVVFGRGETRQVQDVRAETIELLAPGTSPMKAVERLPGVNFQSADPFGAYEWSQRISIRGFNQNQLGFTFDGIPLGDGTYGNHNGLNINRAVSPENVGRVSVSQGAGSIGTQSTNNLGGTLEFFSRNPLGRFGAEANLTYGADHMWRAFGRVDFGTSDGPRGYLSYAYGSTDKWKGDGEQTQQNINARAIVPLGANTDVDLWYSHSFRNEQDYQDLSLGMIRRLGYDWDNFGPGQYALALRVADIANNRGDTGAPVSNAAAGTVYPAPITSVDDAYYDAAGIRRDDLAAIGLRTGLGSGMSFSLKGYYHANKGQGLWGTPYVPSPTGVPISMRTTEYSISRYGLFGSLVVPVNDSNELTIGGWWEQNDFTQARRFYALTSRANAGRTFDGFQRDPFFTQWEYDFDTTTLQYHVEDKIDLGALTVNLGWKGFKVSNNATPVVAGSLTGGSIKVEDWFQPHVGLAYELGDRMELFAGFTQVTRAFASSSTTGPFATTPAGFAAIRNTLKPEQSDTYELGLRYNDSGINAVLAGYYINFRNRLLAFSSGAGIVGNPAVLQNVGAVRALGVELAVDARLGGGFTAYASYAYNDSTYRDNVYNSANVLVAATRGKTVVDSPKHILRGELGYDSETVFGRIGANYMSQRYFTYENDQSVGSRWVVDATLGVHITPTIEVQANVTNLFDEEYVSTIGTNGYGNRGDNQTLMAGAPRQWFVTLKAGF
jgi:iron complex outermembrane receptor protein